ncbi:MAG: hypothetical protein WBQ86_02215 [Candidatus Binatus sp.]
MDTKILGLGYRKATGQSAQVWVALDFISYECTAKRRPQLTAECSSVEELNEQIDAVISELETIRLEAKSHLAANSN